MLFTYAEPRVIHRIAGLKRLTVRGRGDPGGFCTNTSVTLVRCTEKCLEYSGREHALYHHQLHINKGLYQPGRLFSVGQNSAACPHGCPSIFLNCHTTPS